MTTIPKPTRFDRVLIGIAALLLAAIGVVCSAIPADATAILFTNKGSGLIKVQYTNGHQYYVSPGQQVGNVAWILPNAGQCIEVDPGPQVCYPVGYAPAGRSVSAYRTR